MQATVPLWQDEPYAPRAPLRGDTRAEVVVVGGGIGGVASAWMLLERGIAPLLVEGRVLGAGATGRNGGFFLAGAAPRHDEARARWGAERARAVHAATLRAQAAMLEVAGAVGARGHFRIGGVLRLGVDAADVVSLRAHHAALAQDGFPGELVAEAELPTALRRPGRLGLLTPHDGGVHPVRWLRALAAACEARGARVAEGTRVVTPPRTDGAGVVVETAAGVVRAERAVVAADGGLAALVPAVRAVRARRLQMLATAPAPRVLERPVYSRDGYEYVHQTPDGRIALGGFSDLDGPDSWTDREEPSVPVQERLERHLREELGVTAAVTHRWAGVVGYAEDPLPRCGAVPGSDGRLFALGGYNGTGHVQAWVAARIVTELLADGRSDDAGLYAPLAPVW